MYPDSTCNLASINVGYFPLVEFEEELIGCAQSVARFLDNTLCYELAENKSPYPNQAFVVSQLREIGIGFTNFHGWLLKDLIGYDTDEGIAKMESFVKTTSIAAWKYNIELGKEKGNAPAFQAMLDKNNGDHSFIYTSAFARRMRDEADLDLTHLRCMNVMSIAPAGSLSNTFPVEIDSTGLEPLPGFYYWKRSRTSGQYKWYFVIPSVVRRKLIAEGYTDVPSTIEDPNGAIGEKWIEIINKFFDPTIFKPAHHIDPFKKVEMMSKFAKWVDSSMSTTYNLSKETTPETIEKIYYEAWKSGVKSCAVYRDGSREGIIVFEFPKDKDKDKDETVQAEVKSRPTEIPVHAAAMRPAELPCEIYRVSAQGKRFVILVGILGSLPYEVFAAPEEALVDIPKSMKKGIIKKVGKGKYKLMDDKKVILANIGQVINNPEVADYTRLLSTMLRHGVPIDFIVEQLEKVESSIVSLGKALSRVLKNYVGEYYKLGKGKICQSCGGSNLIFEEGCFKCLDCGGSKCG